MQKFRIGAEAKGVELVVRGPTDLPFVAADLGLIERALTNLIENGVRHTPPGGCVTLEFVPGAEGRVRVAVVDDGEGIGREQLERIFDRFYQVPASERRGGAGLGLAITRRILELHGTTVEVASAPGEGSRFSFDLTVAGT